MEIWFHGEGRGEKKRKRKKKVKKKQGMHEFFSNPCALVFFFIFFPFKNDSA